MPPEPRRRHDGQLQACEPCRKAKVRCDHASPSCTRCGIRSLNCIYHPAPRRKHRPLAASASASTSTSNESTRFTARMPATDFQHQIQPAPAAAASSVLGISPRSEGNALFQKSASPHETTRFSAVFFENQDSFGSVIGDGVKCSHEPEQELDMPSWSRMELAYRILLNSPTARTCEMLMTGLHYIHDVWVSPLMIQKCLNQVWTLYGDCLGEDRTRESVMNIANEICANTRKPIAIPTDDAGHDTDSPGWVNWFSGPDLRWEMVGILFSWAGMAFRHKQECDPVFALSEQHGRNRSTAANKMRECAAACIRLCGEHFEISDLMVVCMKNSSKLQSIIISHESQ